MFSWFLLKCRQIREDQCLVPFCNPSSTKVHKITIMTPDHNIMYKVKKGEGAYPPLDPLPLACVGTPN